MNPSYSSVQLLTGPAVEPVTVDECKAFLRVVDNDEDRLLYDFIKAARVTVERMLGKSLISQTVKVYYDAGHVVNNVVLIPRGPVITVDSVKYFDADDALQVVSSSDYQTDLNREPARLKFTTLPDIPTRPYAFEINITAGYGTAAESVPEPIRQAIRYLVAQFYENRSPIVVGASAVTTPLTLQTLLSDYKATLW